MRLGEFRDNAKIPAAAKSGAAQAYPGDGFLGAESGGADK
jgi:hypothetical protein